MAPIVIFGAGKTGRGFAAHLCHRDGFPFALIDKDQALVERLRRQASFDVCVLSSPECRESLRPERSHHIDDDWNADFAVTPLCFTAVFGNNLPELGRALASRLAMRFGHDHPAPLNIITCENLTGAAQVLSDAVFDHLDCDRSTRDAIDAGVGFSEGIVFKTCLGPGAEDDPLTVRAEPVFELSCDADALRGPLPPLRDLKPTTNFSHQLTRKIYTYNAINAVITYLGARRGASMLVDAARDPDVLRSAREAANEASEALVLEFGFDRDEQNRWVERALAKFANDRLPDPLSRNGADPRRKLGREDRLIAPARLALRHGIPPRGIADGIVAAVHFSDNGGPPLLEEFSAGLSEGNDIPSSAFKAILKDVCGLDANEPLYDFLLTRWHESHGSKHG